MYSAKALFMRSGFTGRDCEKKGERRLKVLRLVVINIVISENGVIRDVNGDWHSDKKYLNDENCWQERSTLSFF